MNDSSTSTACVLLIGNELLSGKTQDLNLSFLGSELAKLGIELVEARVIRDQHDTIAAHVNECREKYTYVFTTGGIGPTHDDITSESIARAFAKPLEVHADALGRMQSGRGELNEARMKMARVPAGASLIDNPISKAPGFRIENVFVLAGIPKIARAMFASAIAELTPGKTILSASIDVFASEGDIAGPLEHIAQNWPAVQIGSYPFARDGQFGANLVVRGTDEALITEVIEEIMQAMTELDGKPERAS